MKKHYKKGSNDGYYKLLATSLVLLSMVFTSFQFAVAAVVKSGENVEQIHGKHTTGQLIVKFKEGAGPDAGFLKGYNALSAKKISKADKVESKANKSFKKFGIDRMYMADFSENTDLTKMIKKLNNDPRVEYAEPNYIYHTTEIPNDPDLGELWGFHNTGQNGGTVDADIDAPEAWDIQTGSSNVVIAVIDTGVDYTHPDLAGNIWVNEAELNGEAGVDNDGNGFIDDIHGYDFVNDDGDPFDDHYHGTHCAGTIGAVGDDNIGIVGVNWNVSIMPVKFLSASGSGTTLDAIASVEYATVMGADIMSNSWGGGGYSVALEEAISAANDAGILFVAAAGNSGTNNDMSPHYPSSYDVPNVVSVAATDRNDNKASFSCYGAGSVDLGAPGVNIYSTKPNNTYGALNGTSMATPHVAGAAGLIKAQYPSLASDDIKSRLFGGVDIIPSMEGITVTGGRLNIYNSLEEDSVPPAVVSTLNTSSATYNSVALSWIAVGDDGNTGTAGSYDIRYSISEITEANWDDATQAAGEPVPQAASSTELFEVTGLEFNTTYHFALKVIDNVGNASGISNVVSETTVSPVIAFYDDMESGTNGWIHSGEYDNWELGTPTSGPGYPYSGSNVWATNLSGYYGADYMNAWLTSPSINLKGVGSAQLMFQHHYYTENYFDGGIVEISIDGGISWTQITPNGGYPENALSSANPLGSVPAYSASSGAGWHQAVFDISEYDGYNNVNIRFRFGTDYSVNSYPGWYIDDVIILGESNGGNVSPTAVAGDDQNVSDADNNGIEAVTLDGSASYDPDGSIASYSWFVDAGPSPIGTSTLLEHDFSVGTYAITLVVEDDEGATSTDEVVVIVNSNRAPVADAGLGQFVSDADNNNFETVTLNGSESQDVDLNGNIVSYQWSEEGEVLGETDVITYDFPVGVHEVTLTVEDNGGATSSDGVVVIVNPNQAPVANAGEDQTSVVGAAVNFDGSGSYDLDLNGNIVSYDWNFDDGATGSGTSTNHVYSIADTYTVILTVTDNGGATSTDEVVITVTEGSIQPLLHIADIGMSAAKIKLRGWYVGAAATVIVVDSEGAPISGAEVFGDWSGLADNSVFGTTGEDGEVVLNSDNVKNTSGTFTFTVTNVAKDGFDYDLEGNVETSDSIAVIK